MSDKTHLLMRWFVCLHFGWRNYDYNHSPNNTQRG